MKSMFKIFAFATMLFSASVASSATRVELQPPFVTATIPEAVSGVWTPVNGVPFGLSFVFWSGRTFVTSSWSSGCTNVLGIRGEFPKTTPNAVVHGELVYMNSNPPTFGSQFILLSPGKAGYPARITFNSFDAVTDRLTVTIANNDFGYTGTVVLQRQTNFVFVPSPGC